MLGKLSDWVTKWDRATRTPTWRWSGLVVGVGLLVVLVRLPPPEGLSHAGWRTAAIAVLMALWWVGQVLPMAVTGLVPLIAFPALGIASLGAVAPSYAHPLLYLMLGGFLVAAGMERVGLHRRLVAWLLAPAWVRGSPARVALALMGVCAALSGLVSNTATMVMMLPLAGALAARCTDVPRERSAFVLGLAYAASIGGVSTLVGTPPNAVLAGLAADRGVDIGFGRWMAIGVPFVLVALPVAWWVVTRVVIRLPARAQLVAAPPAPPWVPSEVAVVGVVALALLAWLTRAPITLGDVSLFGWGPMTGWKGSEADAIVALVGGAAMFAIPRRGADGWELLLDWRGAERAVPWSVILLIGGGFALAGAIEDTGLTAWIAGGAGALAGLPLPVTVFGVSLGMTFLTELTSNTASTQIAVPLLAAAAGECGVQPLLWMVPATISASCAFMMPVATAPNAIATEGGQVSPADMALAGLVLNPLLAVVTAALSLAIVPSLFGGP